MPWDGKKLPDGLAVSATVSANAAANGAKNAAYLTHLRDQLGSNLVLKLVRDDVTVWQGTSAQQLSIVNGKLTLPTSVSQSPALSALIGSGQWILKVESATDASKYIATAVTATAGAGPFRLSGDLTAGGGVTLGSLLLNSPTFDIASGALFQQVAVTDMRKPGWSGSYANSYADNDDPVWGRGGSSQRYRSSLTEGKYCKPSAVLDTNGLYKRESFVSAINPDYALELEWGVTGSPPFFSAEYRTKPVEKILFWNQLYLSETYGTSHLPGFANNTRVMPFGMQIWIKQAGVWSMLVSSNGTSGEIISPNFGFTTVYVGADASLTDTSATEDWTPHADVRVESSYGLGTPLSLRLKPYTGLGPTPTAPYWGWHGYSGGRVNINASQIEDILVLQKVSLVLDNPAGTDDRDLSRYLFAVGADYYPADNFTFSNGWKNFLAGIGTSRHKFVTAKWPSWQWSVMHTMSESQFNATNGYPSSLANLVQGA